MQEIQRLAKDHWLAKDKAFLRKLHGEPPTRMPRWKPEELEFFRKDHAMLSNLEIAPRQVMGGRTGRAERAAHLEVALTFAS